MTELEEATLLKKKTELYRDTVIWKHQQKRERGWGGVAKHNNWRRNITTIVGNWVRYKEGKDEIKRKEIWFILVPPYKWLSVRDPWTQHPMPMLQWVLQTQSSLSFMHITLQTEVICKSSPLHLLQPASLSTLQYSHGHKDHKFFDHPHFLHDQWESDLLQSSYCLYSIGFFLIL